MGKLEKRLNRSKRVQADKEERKEYKENRELGPCFVKGCSNNGDMKTHCRFCDYVVQACTGHQIDGRNKAKKHLYLKHPTKSIPAIMLGVLRGQSLE